MSSSNFLESQTLQSQGTVPGLWKLAPGRALSLQPRQTGLLRVAQGQVWVTLDVEHQGAGNELGDYILQAGEQLVVSPGQHLVLERLEGGDPKAVFFELTAFAESTGPLTVQNARAVTLPLRDLGQALGMAGSALLHLCTGLVVYGRQLVLGRPAAV